MSFARAPERGLACNGQITAPAIPLSPSYPVYIDGEIVGH